MATALPPHPRARGWGGKAVAYNGCMRVQIVSSRVGGGHQSVARALVDAIEDRREGEVEVWIDDLYVDLARFPASRFPWMYAVTTRRYPRIWRLVFELTNRPPGPGRLELLGDPIGGPGLARLLARRRPDVVISVLPGANGFIARSLRRAGLGADVEVVVTDWAEIHLSWISKRVSHYTVPTEAAAGTCYAVGVPSAAVSVLGLPVRRQFVEAEPGAAARRAARGRLGLPEERFVILAMVGTEGTAGALAHLEALAGTPLDADLLVMCGRNERLCRRVGELGGINRVQALGFVEDVAELMLAADLLVTKPGGASLAEAFCCHLPVLAFDPVPGQEEGNARYVVAEGAAELADSPRHLAALAAELRWSGPRRGTLAAGGARLARPSAAADTVGQILERAGASAGNEVSTPRAKILDA